MVVATTGVDSGRVWPMVLDVFMISFSIGINGLYTIEEIFCAVRGNNSYLIHQNLGAWSIRPNAFMQRCASTVWRALSQPIANHARGSFATASR